MPSKEIVLKINVWYTRKKVEIDGTKEHGSRKYFEVEPVEAEVIAGSISEEEALQIITDYNLLEK